VVYYCLCRVLEGHVIETHGHKKREGELTFSTGRVGNSEDKHTWESRRERERRHEGWSSSSVLDLPQPMTLLWSSNWLAGHHSTKILDSQTSRLVALHRSLFRVHQDAPPLPSHWPTIADPRWSFTWRWYKPYKRATLGRENLRKCSGGRKYGGCNFDRGGILKRRKRLNWMVQLEDQRRSWKSLGEDRRPT